MSLLIRPHLLHLSWHFDPWKVYPLQYFGRPLYIFLNAIHCQRQQVQFNIERDIFSKITCISAFITLEKARSRHKFSQFCQFIVPFNCSHIRCWIVMWNFSQCNFVSIFVMHIDKGLLVFWCHFDKCWIYAIFAPCLDFDQAFYCFYQ